MDLPGPSSLKTDAFYYRTPGVFHWGTTNCSETLPQEQSYEGLQFDFGYEHIDLQWNRVIGRHSGITMECPSAIVGHYSCKVLSFQADVENALCGVNSIMGQWCEGCPVIHGFLPQVPGYSLFWIIGGQQDSHNFNAVEGRGIRRKEFPSWLWTGWVSSARNICCDKAMYLPLTSTMRDVKISMRRDSLDAKTITVTDISATEYLDTTSFGQQIRTKSTGMPVESIVRPLVHSISTQSESAGETSF
jgi:hypothetical protein